MRTDNPNTYVIRRPEVLGGSPPPCSFWVGASRAELANSVRERKAFQATATEKDLFFDPMLGATAALADWKRARGWRRALRGLVK